MSLKNAVGGIALIAGTTIGAGILAMPVATAHLGFIQTIAIYVTCWFFMTLSALYLLEANLYEKPGANLITMAQDTLGPYGRYFTWVTYLILLYSLLALYLTGSAAWISYSANHFGWTISPQVCALSATLTVTLIIFLGTAVTDWINRFLMIGLISAFATLLWGTTSHIEVPRLLFRPDIVDFTPLPLIITAFGSAIVIPSVTEYLHGKPKQLFNVVFIGCLLPLLIYILWELIIIGTLPLEGDFGLLQIQSQDASPVENSGLRHLVTDVPLAMEQYLQKPWITLASTYFSIFVLMTSLLGVCLSLFDFLADGLHLKKRGNSKGHLMLYTFAPPLALILFYPLGFTAILSFAGFFVAVLLGILPGLMVWFGRYYRGYSSRIEIPGGRVLITVSLLFYLAIMGIEIGNQTTYIKEKFFSKVTSGA